MKKKKTYRRSKLKTLYPDKVIDDCKEIEDWFSGFTNAVAYFEHFGYWAIRMHCTREKIPVTNAIKKSLSSLSGNDIGLLLYLLKLIDAETYSEMKHVIRERNRLVHPGRKGITYRDRKKKDNAIRLLDQSKNCIREIRNTIARKKTKE